MEKNNLLTILIAILFSVIFVSHLHKSGKMAFGNGQENQGENWQHDQGWLHESPQGWQGNVPQTPPPPQQPQKPQEEITKEPTSYEEAVSLAKKTGKNMLLFFSSEGCSHCVAMKRTTLKDESVKKAMKNYIYYEVDTRKERSLTNQYGIQLLPTYKIVTPTEESIKTGIGRKGTREFLIWMEYTKQPNLNHIRR